MANSDEQGSADFDKTDFEAMIVRIRELVGGDPLPEWERRFGAQIPKTIDDWIRWAIRVGWDGEYVRSGDWNVIELIPFVEGHLQRLRDQREAGASDAPSVARIGDTGPAEKCSSASTSDNSAPFSFCPLGDDWNIRYDGRPLFALPRRVGLTYIHQLIAKQGAVFSAQELRGEVERQKSDPANHSQKAAKQYANEFGITPSHVSNAGMTASHEELKILLDKKKEIDVDLEKAERKGDVALIRELEEEREKIDRWLSGNTFKGKAKLLQNDADRAKRAVKKAIKEAIDRIAQKDAACAEHFRNSIRTTNGFEYRPDRRIAWET